MSFAGNISGGATGLALIILFLGTALGVGAPANAQEPWVHSFVALRELYVSPSGSGTGTESNPMSFVAAIDTAAPGDLFWMLEGTYTGYFHLHRSGTAEHPIVFRALAGERVVINGSLEISGAYSWVWGLEITDPTGVSTSGSGIRLVAPGVHVINNVIHDQTDKNGIGAWNAGAGQVVYGNIVYENGQGPNHPHNIYTQNDFANYGYKYIISNMFLDSADVCGSCFNFHAYTENGLIKGFYIQENIVKNGRFLIGGYNEPADNEIVIRNYFYDSMAQLGFRRPTQAEFRDNYLARTILETEWFWGEGETLYSQTAPNVYAGNEILLPPGPHVIFRTSAYLPEGRCEGCPRIQTTDIFDENFYSTPFTATFFADNKNLGTVDFSTWKTAAESAGNPFDPNSTLVPVPSEPKVVVLPNEYEQGRGHLVIYNWGGAATVTVDLSSVLRDGAAFVVLGAKDVYGTPLVFGNYHGPVEVPTGGEEFLACLVRTQPIKAPTGLRIVK